MGSIFKNDCVSAVIAVVAARGFVRNVFELLSSLLINSLKFNR